MVPADSRRIPRVPRYSGYGYSSVVVRVRGCHPLWPLFPKRSAPTDWRYRRPTTPDVRKNTTGLGCSPFARHYWGNHCCFLFLGVLRCFSSPGSPHRTYAGDSRPSACWVVPFGNPRINGHLHLPGAYRSLSRPSSPP